MSDFESVNKDPDTDRLISFIQDVQSENFIWGFRLNNLQYLKALDVHGGAILPKQWVEAELGLLLDSEGRLLANLNHLENIPSYIPLVLNFYQKDIPDEEEGVSASDPDVYHALTRLDVISVKVTNVWNKPFVTKFFENYKSIISKWRSLRNIFTQPRYINGKHFYTSVINLPPIGSYKLCKTEDEEEIEDILIKHSYD